MAITVTSSGGNSIVAAVNGGTSVSLSQLLQSVSVSTDQSVPVVVANTLGPQGVKGDAGAQGVSGESPTVSNISALGALFNISEDTSPQLGANLDVQSTSLFTSTINGDIQFTPNGTGSVNLDGTVKFKRFASGSAPDPFEGGMYADDNDELYFGVS
jgi:hypothetical protein